jgi:hypothetical protein
VLGGAVEPAWLSLWAEGWAVDVGRWPGYMLGLRLCVDWCGVETPAVLDPFTDGWLEGEGRGAAAPAWLMGGEVKNEFTMDNHVVVGLLQIAGKHFCAHVSTMVRDVGCRRDYHHPPHRGL